MNIGLKRQEGIIKNMTLDRDKRFQKGQLFVDFTLPKHPVFRGIATKSQWVPLGGVCDLEPKKILQNQNVKILTPYLEQTGDEFPSDCQWIFFPNGICTSCIKWPECYRLRAEDRAPYVQRIVLNTLADEFGPVSS